MRSPQKKLGLFGAAVATLGSILSPGCFDQRILGRTFMEPDNIRSYPFAGSQSREIDGGVEHNYRINSVQNKNILDIEVVDSQKKVTYLERQVLKKQSLVEYEEGTIIKPNEAFLYGGIFGLAAGPCFIAGGQKDDNEISTGLGIYMIGAGIYFIVHSFTHKQKSSYKQRTGRTNFKDLETVWEREDTKKTSLSEKSGRSVEVKIDSDYFSGETSKTDENGAAKILLEEHMSNWSFTRTELERELRKNLSKTVNKEYIDLFVEEMLDGAKTKSYPLTIKTVSRSYENAKDDSKKVMIEGFGVDIK